MTAVIAAPSSPVPADRQACTCGCHASNDTLYRPTATDDGTVSGASPVSRSHPAAAGGRFASPYASRPASDFSDNDDAASLLAHEEGRTACPLCCHHPLQVDERRPFAGKTVLLLRTSSTARAPVYAQLRRMGMRILVAQPTPNIASFGPDCVDGWIDVETTDVDRLIDIISTPPYAGTIDAVASFDEYGVFPAAQINRRLGFQPLPLSPDALSMVNIKSRFREWCVAHGIAAPRFAAVRDPNADVMAAVRAAGMQFPIVAKPAPGAGSNLVTLADDAASLVSIVDRLWAAIAAMKPSAAHFEALGEPIHVLLEEFVEGPEVDVDAIVAGGEVRFAGVSDNFPTARPYFSEVGGLAPSALAPSVQDAMVELLEAFVAATGDMGECLTGVLHFEAKYDERRGIPVVIEVNCRMGSAETHTMVQTAFGVDLAEAAMRIALGMPLQELPAVHVPRTAPAGRLGVYAASANLYPSVAGSLVDIVPPEPQPHLVCALPFPMPRGAPVRLPPHSFGCLLWLVATGTSADDAIANMKALCDRSAINVEESTA